MQYIHSTVKAFKGCVNYIIVMLDLIFLELTNPEYAKLAMRRNSNAKNIKI